MTILHKLLLAPVLFVLLVFACVLGEEPPAPCYYIAGGFNFNCTPTNPQLIIPKGQQQQAGASVEITCCFTGDAWNNTNQAKVMVNQRDEWFYKIQQPDGSFKSMTELYPATAYISNIQAPGQSIGFQPFTIKVDFSLPAGVTFDPQGNKARVDISLDILPEPIPTNPIVILLMKEVETPPAPENPIQTIVKTVTNLISPGGNTGKGGAGGSFIMNLFQTKNETEEPANEPEAQPATAPLPEEKEKEPEGQPPQPPQEDIGPRLPQIELKVPDLSVNYTLIGAGVLSLLAIVLIIIVFKPW